MDREELYFCMYLTESEHWVMQTYIEECLKDCKAELKYYRKLKDGHIPMHREIKIVGEKSAIQFIKRWLVDKKYDIDVVANPHRVKSE